MPYLQRTPAVYSYSANGTGGSVVTCWLYTMLGDIFPSRTDWNYCLLHAIFRLDGQVLYDVQGKGLGVGVNGANSAITGTPDCPEP